ncbi:MAG: hypothetical protein LBC51_00540 [Treponema sp.]|nr:hypothetical protein [Treponema sp.]
MFCLLIIIIGEIKCYDSVSAGLLTISIGTVLQGLQRDDDGLEPDQLWIYEGKKTNNLGLIDAYYRGSGETGAQSV